MPNLLFPIASLCFLLGLTVPSLSNDYICDSYQGDDTSKLSQCLAAVQAAGSGRMILAPRTWNTTGKLKVTVDGVGIIGDPSGLTVIKFVGSFKNALIQLSSTSGNPGLSNIELKNLTLDGAGKVERGIWIQGLHFSTLDRINVIGTTYVAYLITAVTHGGVSENRFGYLDANTKNTGTIGMMISGTEPPLKNVHHNVFEHVNIWTGWGDGIRILGSDSNLFTFVRTWKQWPGTSGAGYGIRFGHQTPSGDRPRSNVFTAASLELAGFCVDTAGQTSLPIENNVILNNIPGNGSSSAPHCKGPGNVGVQVISGAWKD